MKNNIRMSVQMALAGIASLTLITAPVLAADHMQIRGNGYGSVNSVSIDTDRGIGIFQSGTSDISTQVSVHSDTGNAHSGYATGGETVVSTGDSDTNVRVYTEANLNNAGWGSQGDHGMNPVDWFMVHVMGRKLHASLQGENEVPGPGDSDGWGSAHIRVHPSDGHLCVKLVVSGIDTPTAAHIHQGQTGVAGPVVVSLPTPTNGEAVGCMSIDTDLARNLKDNPSDYYVNVHNAPFPNGAIRGQLAK
jgi:hypothetical protein